MRAVRLREAALGRLGLQLHDGLRHLDALPSGTRELEPPRVRAGEQGWWVTWSERPTGGRLAVAARLRDRQGRLRAAEGPFTDDRGRFLWCRRLDERPLFLPWFGVPAGPSELELVVFELGRGPARPLGQVRVELPSAPGQPWDALAWASPVVVLARALVHADGVVRSSEKHALSVLLRELGIDEAVDLDAVLSVPTPARLDPAVGGTLARLAGWGPRTLLEHLVRVAVANGAPSPAERAVLLEITSALGVPPRALERMLIGWDHSLSDDAPDLSSARALLGVPDGASRAAIKQAWRTRMRDCHPDRLTSSDPLARAEANRRSAALNAAYEVLYEYAETARPAPPRQSELPDEVPMPDVLPDLPPPRRGLSNGQVAMGFVALALLAFAVGLAVNGHVEQVLVAVVGEASAASE